ncbi:SAM-dependent methyltransferase [Actinomadura litoris]|uniref:S-adenosyl methyltransferase n=1 Tax=Actinomadura litoris TaxID=2678616 RepID=A0A7K1LB58_9ACTN|nr:SAM-dependent methyltransferase [Actinomadura litoris]MUN41660.1 hypothetical protein [Actinomadura litoris]
MSGADDLGRTPPSRALPGPETPPPFMARLWELSTRDGVDWVALTRNLLGSAIDDTVPHPPRLWNHWCGGKDAFAIDKEFCAYAEHWYPHITAVAAARRTFRARAVQVMLNDLEVDQLLVAGTDLPLFPEVRDEVHQVVEDHAPWARIVYADADPHVMQLARVRLPGDLDEGEAGGHIDAGLEDPGAVLRGAAQALDFTQPVGVLLSTSLDLLDDVQAVHALRALREALAPGSPLAISHLAALTDQGFGALCHSPPGDPAHAERMSGLPRPRTHEGVRALCAGLDLLQPGIVPANRWRPTQRDLAQEPIDLWCAIGQIPTPTATA